MLLVALSPVAGLKLPTTAGCSNGRVLSRRGLRKAPAPTKSSLNTLLQSESFDAIKRNVDQLACLTDQFPGYQGLTSILVIKEELDAVSKLSGDIMNSLDKIALLREQRSHVIEASDPIPSSSSSSPSIDAALLQAKPPPYAQTHATPTCRRCGVMSTPKWRAGPAGLRTLCNFCGLVHSKRA